MVFYYLSVSDIGPHIYMYWPYKRVTTRLNRYLIDYIVFVFTSAITNRSYQYHV